MDRSVHNAIDPWIRLSVRMAALVLLPAAAYLSCSFMCGPTSRSRSIVERLEKPRRVVAKSKQALILEDGDHVALPGVKSLNESTPIMDAACLRGVELQAGRPIGLIRIHHWCGNDSVGQHIAAVDLADLVVYCKEGEGKLSDPFLPDDRPRFSTAGLDVSDYFAFHNWIEIRQKFNSNAQPRSQPN